jgi:hypothetical protein
LVNYETFLGLFSVTNDPGSKRDQGNARRRDGQITFGKLSKSLGLRAVRIPSCVQYIGTLGGCGLQGGWYQVYDSVCHAEGFGLLLAKGCDPIAAPTPCKQKYPLKISAHINRTAVYA